MNFQEILAKMTPESQTIINAEITKAKGEIPEATAATLEAETKAKLDAEGEAGKSEEDIFKALPAEARAILEKSKLQAQAATDAVIKMKADNM